MGTTLSTKPEPDSQFDGQSSDKRSVKLAQASTGLVKLVQTVRCPTCGSLAQRSLLRNSITSNGEYAIQTACPSCDYLMVITSLTGRVLEAYAPGQVSE